MKKLKNIFYSLINGLVLKNVGQKIDKNWTLTGLLALLSLRQESKSSTGARELMKWRKMKEKENSKNNFQYKIPKNWRYVMINQRLIRRVEFSLFVVKWNTLKWPRNEK